MPLYIPLLPRREITWLEPMIKSKTSSWAAVNFKKTRALDELYTCAHVMVT